MSADHQETDAPDRWYSWTSRMWFENTADGYRACAEQGPEPTSFLDGLSREERLAYKDES